MVASSPLTLDVFLEHNLIVSKSEFSCWSPRPCPSPHAVLADQGVGLFILDLGCVLRTQPDCFKELISLAGANAYVLKILFSTCYIIFNFYLSVNYFCILDPMILFISIVNKTLNLKLLNPLKPMIFL